MKTRFLTLAALMWILWLTSAPSLWASEADDAIVRIVVTPNSGATSVGTGTVISTDGMILTCYHVVRDAKEISVSFAGKPGDLKAKIISVAPEYDLAKLQLINTPAVAATHPISTAQPKTFYKQTTAFGYPAKFAYSLHAIEVSAMDNNYTASGSVYTEGGRNAIFVLPYIDLITFSTVIENGASGSPLLFDGQVVGVISGSWSTQGSNAWAMPVKYISRLRPLTADESRPGHWPPVNLVTQYSTLGRSSVNLSAKVLIAVGTFSQAMRNMEDACADLQQIEPQVKTMLQERLTQAEAAVRTLGGKELASNHPGVPGTSVDLPMLLILTQLAPCAQSFNDVRADGAALTDQVNTYAANLSQLLVAERPHDPTVLKDIRDHVKKLTDLVSVWATANQEFVYGEPEDATIADYRDGYQKDVNFMKDKDLPRMYSSTIDELAEYYKVANRLTATK